MQRLYHRPHFFGLEHLKHRTPTLFAGNHTLYGVLDVPLMVERIYRETGKLPRSLADHTHYLVPGWRDLLARFGAVRGTRENCSALMRLGENVLVFPGGGREVAKRRGEAYRLLWKERTGFARLATEHAYSITPFAAVGAEECYDIRIDADDIRAHPLWKWLEPGPLGRLTRGGELLMPLSVGALGTPAPRRQRFYYAFGAPISTQPFRGHEDDPAAMLTLQRQVKSAVEQLISDCQSARETPRPRQHVAEVT